MKGKIAYLVFWLVMGCCIGWIGHTVIQLSTQKQADVSLFEKKAKCNELREQWNKNSWPVDRIFYSKKLDTCIAGEYIYNGWESVYELIDMIGRKSLGSFAKETYWEEYYQKYLEAIKELE